MCPREPGFMRRESTERFFSERLKRLGPEIRAKRAQQLEKVATTLQERSNGLVQEMLGFIKNVDGSSLSHTEQVRRFTILANKIKKLNNTIETFIRKGKSYFVSFTPTRGESKFNPNPVLATTHMAFRNLQPLNNFVVEKQREFGLQIL
jgi:hypothetical protein